MTVVRQSKLRKRDIATLGPQYEGSRVSRDTLFADESDEDPFVSGGTSLYEDSEESDVADPEDVDLDGPETGGDDEIDSDEAFGDGDEEKFEEYAFRGSKIHGMDIREDAGEEEDDEDTDIVMNGANGAVGKLLEEGASSRSEEDQEVASSGMDEDLEEDPDSVIDDSSISDDPSASSSSSISTSSKSSSPNSEPSSRKAIREMMSTSKSTVLSTLSLAAKADQIKGAATKHQQKTFSTLLNTRIRLQKALTASNALPPTSSTTILPTPELQAAETAALGLWTALNTLRHSLAPAPDRKKRPFTAILSTPTADLWAGMQSHETHSIPTRRRTLEKWSLKTQPPPLPSAKNKFSTTPTQTPLLTLLDTHLAPPNSIRLLSQSLAAPQSTSPTSQKTYDDTPFYTALLRSLLSERMSQPHTATTTASPNPLPLHPPKRRKQVDTKASKGRKLRYTVQEKLQNFTAVEDRGGWGERQEAELFGSLLGRRGELGEESEEDGGDEGIGGEEDGLRLFRS